jgi:hypothetical protein
MGGVSSTVGGRGEIYTRFWWENLRETPGIDGRMLLRWIYRKWDWEAWTGLIWLRIGTGGGLL